MIASALIFVILALTSTESKKLDVSSEVDDILKMRPGELSLNYDPFFAEDTFGSLEKVPYVDSEPDFVYEADHITPYQVKIPEHSEETQESAPKRSESYQAYRKPLNRETFFDEDPFATHENLEVDSTANDKKKKWKKGKKGKKGKRKHPGRGGGGGTEDETMYKRQSEPAKNDEESDDVDYKYSIDFEPSDEYQRIKAISDQQRADLTKKPGNCKVFQSDGGQTCYECLDPNTGDTSESCTYDDDHSPAKYAYETSSSFKDKEAVPNEEDFEDEEEPTTTAAPKKGRKRPKKSHNERRNPRGAKKFESLRAASPTKKPKKEEDYYNYDDDADADTYYDTSYDAEVLEPYKHSFYFSAPHKTHEEVKQAPQEPYAPVYDSKTDVDSALDDFNTRDWSSCAKKTKGDLTCYQCEDEKGVKHEDCMFVQESRPASVRVIYRGPKRLHTTTPPGTVTFGTTTATTISAKLTPVTEKPSLSTSAKPREYLKVAPKVNRQKTKKIVIVKRRKPGKKPKSGSNDDDDDDDDDGEIVEKRTIKRRIKVTLKGNNATMPANYSSQVLHDMKDFKI